MPTPPHRTSRPAASFIARRAACAACVALGVASAGHGARSFVAGEVILLPAPGRTDDLAVAVQALGIDVLDRDRIGGGLLIAVPAGAETASIAGWRIGPHRGLIAAAERNGIGFGGGDRADPPDDTSFAIQWHLRNTGQSGGTPGADVAALDAWALGTGDPSIVIAVLDSGIDSDHPEFVGRIAPGGFDFVGEDDDPEADHPHGTWVSGVIAANADNGFGVVGIDHGARVVPIKVLDSQNAGTTFDLVQGINYAASRPEIRILSMSLIRYPGSTSLAQALANARAAGKILIACAGNDGVGNADVSWPGASPNTLSIGATNRTDARAGFSGTGAALDFVAPGRDIATVADGTSADTFAVVSGCSFATPLVSGIVALMLERAATGGQSLDHDDVRALLVEAAVDQVGPPSEDTPGRDDFFGHGRIDARLALEAVCPPDATCLPCSADFDGDDAVGFSDLVSLLTEWGFCFDCPQDLDGDFAVGFDDLLALLAAYGPCP